MWHPRTRERWLERQEQSRIITQFEEPNEYEQLRENVEIIIQSLYILADNGVRGGHKSMRDEAINWGDLGVAEVRLVRTEDGAEAWEIIVEEAAPDCVALPRYIEEWLKVWGWGNVAVRTEW